MALEIFLSSEVNVLTNSLYISDMTKADFLQLHLPRIRGESRLIVVPCLLEQCLEPVNTLITEWCSEARPFRRLSNPLFRIQEFWK